MNGNGPLLKNILTLVILGNFSTGVAWAQQDLAPLRMSTLSYGPAVTLMADQATIQIGSHATT
ncbi:MAG: hypothetical protein VB862_12670, partial [Pirellulaceae bacterium]